MKKFALLSATALFLVACSSYTNDYNGVYAAPALNISNSTGSFVGSKVNAFTKEYNAIRDDVNTNAENLLKVQQKIAEADTEYNDIIASMEEKLSCGTTPSNPDMVAALEKAQKNLGFLEESTLELAAISSNVMADKEKLEALKSAVNASYGIPGAYDADHADLNAILSAANRQESSTADLVAAVKSDIAAQQKKAEMFRQQITRLNVDVAAGYMSEKSRSQLSQIQVRQIQPDSVITEPAKDKSVHTSTKQVKLAKKVAVVTEGKVKKKELKAADNAKKTKVQKKDVKKVEKKQPVVKAEKEKVKKVAEKVVEKPVEAPVEQAAKTEVKEIVTPQILVGDTAAVSLTETKEKVETPAAETTMPKGTVFSVDFNENDEVVYYDVMVATIRETMQKYPDAKLEVLALMPMDTAQQERAQNLSARIFGQLLDLQVPPENLQINSRSEINRKYPTIVILKK